MWGEKPLAERNREEAMTLAIRLLQTAALFDSATGQARPEDDIYPTLAILTGEGYHFLNNNETAKIFETSTKRS
jgi:proteasome beta subunit